MMKWVEKTKKEKSKKDEISHNNNDKNIKQKKVTFRQTVIEISAVYCKNLDILFNLGYRKNILVNNGNNTYIVNLPDEEQVTKTVLKS